MSVEQPLWRALAVFRLLALGYAVARLAGAAGDYRHPAAAWAIMAVLAAWTVFAMYAFTRPRLRRPAVLGADLLLAVGAVLATLWVDDPARIEAGAVTLPTVMSAAPVLAWSIHGGWRLGGVAATVVGVTNVVERGELTQSNFHNIVLLLMTAGAVGHVVDLARTSERVLARALRLEAATRERERLARDIHDSVLQVLALVQRRGAEIGGPAAELGRLAGEQEGALRRLIQSSPVVVDDPAAGTGSGSGSGAGSGAGSVAGSGSGSGAGSGAGSGSRFGLGGRAGVRGTATAPDAGPEDDLRALVGRLAGARVTVSAPGTPVLLPEPAARELTAAVRAALDNVERHAGEGARAWILVEDEPDEVVVSVRDDGPGIPAGRLAEAAADGRMGVARSIEGRVRDLGGSVEICSVPGQGTEIEMRVPRPRGHRDAGTR